jgi:hypothetical protein
LKPSPRSICPAAPYPTGVHIPGIPPRLSSQRNQIYFILAGTFDVVVNGRRVAGRGAGDHVGEMAAVQPAQRRSATVTALEEAIVAKLSAEAFSNLGSRHSQLYRLIAQELARRVLQLESRSIEWAVIPIAILPAAYGAIKPTLGSDAELQPP